MQACSLLPRPLAHVDFDTVFRPDSWVKVNFTVVMRFRHSVFCKEVS